MLIIQDTLQNRFVTRADIRKTGTYSYVYAQQQTNKNGVPQVDSNTFIQQSLARVLKYSI